MNQARTAITNLFNNEPQMYTRFNLAGEHEGESNHVEMKLSSEDDDVGEHHNNHMTTPIIRSRKTRKNFCFMVAGALLLFFIGFLLGYLAYRSRSKDGGCQQCASADGADTTNQDIEEYDELVLYWNDLKEMLSKKIKLTSFEDNINAFSRSSHDAGSEKDEDNAAAIHEQFLSYGLNKVWHDEHYVRLQFQHRSLPNKVTFLNPEEVVETPSAYLAYSAQGTPEGKLVYANFGRKEDFQLLSQNVNINGCIVLVRAGKNSFAEKVANAQKMNAKGVLIYPDPEEYSDLQEDTVQFGHVHMGTGDPYTPGFPSFNHTQFPPVKSSGLPQIPAQTISRRAAKKLFSGIGGPECPVAWRGSLSGIIYRMGNSSAEMRTVKLEVNNVNEERKIFNVFGVLNGFVDADRYIVIGAQRDSWGPGVAKSAVGTSILLELARILSDLVKDGYKPMRSVVFASWTAGDFGAVGATEWLEGYLPVLHAKAFAYINLDAAIQGLSDFQVSGSPILLDLVEKTIKNVKSPVGGTTETIYEKIKRTYPNWKSSCVQQLSMENAAYPFLSYTGIPSVSFSVKRQAPYQFLGTNMDTLQQLKNAVDYQLDSAARAVTEVAAQMAIRLTHDHQLYMDYEIYSEVLKDFISEIRNYEENVKSMGLSFQWLYSATGDFSRAAFGLTKDFEKADLTDQALCRALNDRIMKVEYNFLSPYVSTRDAPFRHIFFGSGNYTLSAIKEHLNLRSSNISMFDEDLFRNQLALVTWTIKGAGNSLTGDIWDIDNEF
ncbi:transferrin receptor protein 1 [Protopterus annectens]|uniref:transferrin receptor protein 1 n=1 Tax=Protopterus annectens TaxID=7888 RepID=UPI001CFBEC1C|nr:transferrin receptor protein 1 [Protopterus annectens]